MFKTSTVLVSDTFPEGLGRSERYGGFVPISAFSFPWDGGGGKRQSTETRLAASRTSLYVLFEAEDADLVAFVAEDKGSVFEDDCLEIFLMPEEGAYYGFEINPKGALLDYRVSIGTDGALEFDYAYRSRAAHVAKPTRKGWTAEFSIPFSGISPRPPVPGETWRCALNRIDRGPARPPVYASWCDFQGARPNFHQPLFFNRLLFASAAGAAPCV